MGAADPADFYTGLVAELYGVLRSEAPDPGVYERFVRRAGEPALELACGDGDPMLDLVAAGLDVHGLDSSADMLDRCRRRAADRGLTVVLHHQPMQAMALPQRYRSMFLAGASFNLLPDDEAALGALQGMAAHLEPGGTALVPLFVPEPVTLGRAPSTATLEDGTVLRCGAVGARRADDARVQVVVLRYEQERPGAPAEVLDREWSIHWHTPDGFADLVSRAGLEVRGQRALDGGPTDGAGEWTALLRQPG